MDAAPAPSASSTELRPGDVPTRSRRREIWALVLSVFAPGMGYLILGRPWRGLFAFVVFAVALNSYILGGALLTGEAIALWLNRAGLPVAIVVWAVSIIQSYRLGIAIDRTAAHEKRRSLLRESLILYVKGDLAGSRSLVEEAVSSHLDPDREELDALFHLGVLHLREGNTVDAYRTFRQLARRDIDGKWAAEVERERAAATSLPIVPAAPTPLPTRAR